MKFWWFRNSGQVLGSLGVGGRRVSLDWFPSVLQLWRCWCRWLWRQNALLVGLECIGGAWRSPRVVNCLGGKGFCRGPSGFGQRASGLNGFFFWLESFWWLRGFGLSGNSVLCHQLQSSQVFRWSGIWVPGLRGRPAFSGIYGRFFSSARGVGLCFAYIGPLRLFRPALGTVGRLVWDLPRCFVCGTRNWSIGQDRPCFQRWVSGVAAPVRSAGAAVFPCWKFLGFLSGCLENRETQA